MFIIDFFKIDRLRFLPNAVVFLIDIIISFFATVFTVYLFNLVAIKIDFNNEVFLAFALYFLVIGCSFYFTRTYTGVIRHTTFEDAVNLIFALSLSFTLLFLINNIYTQITGTFIYSNLMLFYATVLNYVCLLIYRIFIKKIFEYYLESKKLDKKLKVVIYGVTSDSVRIAQSINSDINSNYKIVGFVSKSLYENRNGTFLMKKPVRLMTKPMYVMLRSLKANTLIIPENSLPKADNIEIVNDCLKFNFKVFSASTMNHLVDFDAKPSIKNFEITDLLERDAIELDKSAISKNLYNQVILITGAAGSIGSEIVRQVLRYKPKQIICLDFAESPLHTLSLEVSKNKYRVDVKYVIADIRDREVMESIFLQYNPKQVYHAAAYKHVPLMEENPLQSIQTNVFGTKNIADLSIKFNVDRFVMVSTDKAVRPSNVMGASKRVAEKYIQALSTKSNNNTKFITTRFGNVLGSNGSVVPLFKKQIDEGGPITITHPDIIRYFMTISEACQLVLEAAAMGNGGEIFLFDMGEPVRIIDLAHKMIRLAGLEPEMDIKTNIIGLRPGEKLYEELLFDTKHSKETYNSKITIAIDTIEDLNKINKELNDLYTATKTLSNDKMVAQLKIIVHEYISLNSKFVALDKTNK